MSGRRMTFDPELAAGVGMLMQHYFVCLDQRDYDAVGRCFTPNSTSQYGGIELPPGRQAVVDYVRAALSSVTSTRHFATGVDVRRVSKKRAQACTMAMVFVVEDSDGAEHPLQVRGLRYDDVLKYHDGCWRIHRREHQVEWVSTSSAQLAVKGRDPLVLAGTSRGRSAAADD